MKNSTKSLVVLYITMVVGVFSILSCKNKEFFDKEQYKKMVYIVSGQYNVFSAEYSFDNGDSVRHISIATSGSQVMDRDIDIELGDDTQLLPIYNKINFDADTNAYAKELKSSQYVLPARKLTLKANSTNALLPVMINSQKLLTISPDSTYFLPLTITRVSGYEVNSTKRNVLFRVFAMNAYARTLVPTYYTLKGYRIDTNGTSVTNSLITSSSKLVQPLSKNKIRMFIANNSFVANLETINRNAITVQIRDDNKLIVEAYKSGEQAGLSIEQLNVPANSPNFIYNNTYDPVNRKFLIYYRYKTYTKETNTWSRWFYVQEEVRRLD